MTPQRAAQLHRAIAEAHLAMAAELDGDADGTVRPPSPPKQKTKPPRILVVPHEDRKVSPIAMARARGALRRAGVVLGPEEGSEK